MAKSKAKGKLMGMEYMPADDVLVEMGRITIRHSFLDWTLNRTIKTLARMTPEQADFAFAAEGSASLRRKVLHVAATKFGKQSETYGAVKKLVDRCESLTKARNRYTHNLWLNIEGKAVLFDLSQKDQHQPLPKASELKALSERIRALYSEINDARLKQGGFLFDAVKKLREAEKAAPGK